MRAISLQQPYASAILDGSKRIENRRMRLGMKPGQWLWLHASAGFYFHRRDWPEARDELLRLWPEAPREMDDYPRGVILGATLCGETYEHHGPPQEWAFGPYCTRIEAVVKLPEPVPCKGALGLWTPPPDVQTRLEDGLERTQVTHLTMNQWASLLGQGGRNP